MHNNPGFLSFVVATAHGKSAKIAVSSEHDHITASIKNTGNFYESQFLDALTSILKPGDLVIDVGANVGNHTLYFSQILGCHVVAYEPVEEALRCLLHSVELNFADERVEVRPFAVGKTSGRARVHSTNKGNLGATSLMPSIYGDIVLTSLDEQDFEGKVAFIKIDVEGMDLDVICGAKTLIERDRPFISCEINDEKDVDKLSGILEELDYASLGRFNASPTFVLAPVRTLQEQTSIIKFQVHQMQTIREAQAEFNNRLLRSNRYTERLHREALQKIAAECSVVDTNGDVNDSTDREDAMAQRVNELYSMMKSLRASQDKSQLTIESLEREVRLLRGEEA
ncbi:FkbM family methyltransferase [Arthrobacter sp. R4]|uniref:FkbM family methyltransferase n=1 Tax=Arthrobacter sp. R4 TaxID=644417 RepID=UPI003EDA83B1